MRGGFTLIELTVALALSALTVTIAGAGAAGCVRDARLAHERERAARLAEAVADSLVAVGGSSGARTEAGVELTWTITRRGALRSVEVRAWPVAAPRDTTVLAALGFATGAAP